MKLEREKSIRTGWGMLGAFLKRHRRPLIVLVLLLILLSGFFIFKSRKSKKPQMQQTMTAETVSVERMDLTNSISVTGTIATAEGKTQTTTLSNLKVTNVYVEVGDEVQEGDIICTFDSSDIEEALSTARNNYSINQQLDALGNDYTTQYNESVEQAEDTLQGARDKRDEAKSAYQNASDAENAAKTAYETAAEDLKTKQAAYEEAQKAAQSAAEAYEAAKGSGMVISDLDAYIKNLVNPTFAEDAEEEKSAYSSLDAAVSTYQAAKAAYEEAGAKASQAKTSYEQAQSAASQAYSAYEQAQSAREDAQEIYEDSLNKAQETYEKAQLNDQLITDSDEKKKIEEYEEQLEDCTVRASMTGVVTSLSVEEGETFAGGAICEIQDMSHFIVEAAVDEYDIVDISKGMTAYVKTDSMGDTEMEAEVTYVAPTGTTGSQMGSVSGTASYEIQITIQEAQERLRSGMTAKVSISLEESKDTLAVPYDCVQTNANGDSVIYIDDNGERKEVIVETGIETDYYIEVISGEIQEGTAVYLSTPLLKSDGTGQSGNDEEEAGMVFDMGGGMEGGGAPSGGPSGGAASGGGRGGF